jgi:hypothetical protein
MIPTAKSSGPVETGGGGGMVGVRVVVAGGVGQKIMVIVKVGVGGTRVGSRVPGASGGKVASLAIPGVAGAVSGDGEAEPAKVQASSAPDNSIRLAVT